MQNSMTISDFQTSLNQISTTKRLIKNQNFAKPDVILIKQNAMFPTIVPAIEKKISIKCCETKKYVRAQRVKDKKEPEVSKSTTKLDQKMEYLCTEGTRRIKNRKLIEDKGLSLESSKLENSHADRLLSGEGDLSGKKSVQKTDFIINEAPKLQINRKNPEKTYKQKTSPINKEIENLEMRGKNSEEISVKRSSSDKKEIVISQGEIEISRLLEQKLVDNVEFKSPIDEKQISKLTSREESTNLKEDTKISEIFIRDKQSKFLKSKENKLNCQVKYSWENISSWIPPCKKREIEESEKKNLSCKRIYSWQILGTAVQTSNNLLNESDDSLEEKNQCSIKYSWQIIGKTTQVSLDNQKNLPNSEKEYWRGVILSPRKNYNSWTVKKLPKSPKNRKNIRILCNETTQTLINKNTQTEFTDSRIKYSWENLISQSLKNVDLAKLETEENTKKQYQCTIKYSWQNLIRERLYTNY